MKLSILLLVCFVAFTANGQTSKELIGKWKLSDDNKELAVRISIISVKFTVDYSDTKKRIISSDKTGTLEYEKVQD